MVEIDDETERIVISFDDDEDKEIYKQKTEAGIKNRVHQSIYLASLDELGARTRFIRYLHKIEFSWFLRLKIDAVPLMFAQEFFTTFRFTATTDLDKPTIYFRLLGIDFEMSLTEWAVRLGVATAAETKKDYWRKLDRGVPGKYVTFDGKAAWRRIARNGAKEFSANRSLGADIMDPLLRLVQIYLGFNLQGQDSCFTKVSLTELYFMRKIQIGEGVNLAFWLAYQAHQINRSKVRHLNLCHIVGAFMSNSLDLISTHRAPMMQVCVTPRLFDLDFLIEHQIVRVVDGLHRFYEPGTVTSKTRKRLRSVQGQVKTQSAEGDGGNTLEWLVQEQLCQRDQIGKIHNLVSDMMEAIKSLEDGAGTSGSKKKNAAQKVVIKEEDEEEEVEKESGETEQDDQDDSCEDGEESSPGTDEESPAETEKERKKEEEGGRRS